LLSNRLDERKEGSLSLPYLSGCRNTTSPDFRL
jgi:hypothetical protein